MAPSPRALILFVRNPDPGRVKTRLAASVGDDAALHVYRHLLERTRDAALGVEAVRYVFYSDRVERGDLFGEGDFLKYAQCSGGLGERMDYAFSIPFKNGRKRAVILGSDCPGLQASHIEEAFEALDIADLAIGPAGDGGYWTLGMKKWHRGLFEGIPWSTPEVLERQLARAGELGLTHKLLRRLDDLDTAGDMERLLGDEGAGRGRRNL